MASDIGKEQQEDNWKVTKEFLTSDPRSAQIREVSIGILNRLRKLLYDTDVADSRDEQSQLYAELEALGGKLIELKINPEMHVGLPIEDFKKSPVKTAEWVAGQIFLATGATVPSESSIRPIVEEFSEAKTSSTHLTGTNLLENKKMKDYIKLQATANFARFLDIQPEEKSI